MNKRSKLFAVWLAVSAAVIIAGIVLFALLGFNTSPDRMAGKTVDIRYNIVVELSDAHKETLRSASENAFAANGVSYEEALTLEGQADPTSNTQTSFYPTGNDFTLRYVFEGSVSAEALQAAADDIRRQHEGGPALREADPRHAPYYRLSRAISDHRIPDPDRIEAIGRRSGDGTYESIGSFEACGLTFEAYEGNGGHIPGDTVFACRELRLVFTGDDLINPEGSTKRQSEFNTLAPYLMESVNTDSAKARECRKRLTEMFDGWRACPGHGSLMTIRNA